MAEILGGKPIEGYNEKNVNASINQLMDTIQVTTAVTYEWLFSLEDTTNNKYRSGKIVATHKDALNPDYSVININGDDILHTIDLLYAGGTVSLYIQNGEAHTIKIKVRRVLI